MAKITATFTVNAGTYAEGVLNVAGLTPDDIALKVEGELDVDTSVCHQCSHNISDPEPGDLTGFAVDGVEYELRDGHWVVVDE